MKRIVSIFAIICLVSCSPYKKVTVTSSDVLTKRWKGASAQDVKTSMGPYKLKAALSDGYLIRFDYSYVINPAIRKNDFQVRASSQQSSIMNPWNNNSNSGDHQTADDSVIRRMDFYFDKLQRVKYVMSIGFPDSVYYVKRR